VAFQAALLRGINVGSHRRISMPALRDELARAGLAEVQTYVQSGNLVLDMDLSEAELAAAIEAVLSDSFGFADVPVIVRGRDELARIVGLDPLRAIVTEDKRYQVCFLSAAPAPKAVAELRRVDAAPEALHVDGREIYTWHPEGIQRSKLTPLLSDRRLGVTVTARNWRTVIALLEMMGGGDS
jgi:uncharacterized protein (DUF1697 family)